MPEEIIQQMRAWIEGGKKLIDGPNGAQVEVGPAPNLAADLAQVAVHLLERRLTVLEEGVELGGIRDELFPEKPHELRGLPILGSPEGSDLADTPVDAASLTLAKLGR